MLTKDDKKDIKNIVLDTVGSLMEDILIPKFEAIDKRFTDTEDDISDLHLSVTRIERKLDSVIERQDNQEIKYEKLDKRVLKLEVK